MAAFIVQVEPEKIQVRSGEHVQVTLTYRNARGGELFGVKLVPPGPNVPPATARFDPPPAAAVAGGPHECEATLVITAPNGLCNAEFTVGGGGERVVLFRVGGGP